MAIVRTEVPAVSDTPPGTRKVGKQSEEPKYTDYVQPEYKHPEESKAKVAQAVASGVRSRELNGHETLRPSRLLSA